MGGMGGMGGLGGMGGMGGMFGGGNAQQGGQGGANPPTDPFPNLFAPNAGQGATPSTPGQNTAGAGNDQAATTQGGLGTQGGAAANPFAGLFGMPGMGGMGGMGGLGGMGGAGAGAGGNGGGNGGNPFGNFDPAMLFGGGAGGMGGMGGGTPWNAPARDTRPPEELYATQLGQLNAMVSVVSPFGLVFGVVCFCPRRRPLKATLMPRVCGTRRRTSAR